MKSIDARFKLIALCNFWEIDDRTNDGASAVQTRKPSNPIAEIHQPYENKRYF